MDIQAELVAVVERELAELKAADTARRLPRRGVSGPSTVYTIRLDPDEVEALERRAAASGIRPTVLARNLIRVGLSAGRGGVNAGTALSETVDRLADTVAELRSLVP